ncbi:MAG TPA: RIP metalloprotease RseP [Edaphocola sp.]|nr:RIP metalloprotease RseP [Edaphocola sp.]
MEILITIAQFIVALSLLIVLHEGGHFFFAKLFKTRVEKFYLFFDFLFPFGNILPFSLWKKKKGETTYGIGWFPLGGYVKIAGMVDESMDTEQLAKPPEPWEFRSKKPWQRLLIMLGGIIVNVLLAFLIFAGVLYKWGTERLPMSEVNKNGGVIIMDSIGYKAGLMDGDKIVAIDGKEVKYFNSLMSEFITAKDITVERNGKQEEINLPIDLIGQFVDANKQIDLFSFNIPVIVGEAAKGGNAAKAGIKVGDEIKGINQLNISNIKQLQTELQQFKNQEVTVKLFRDGNEITLPVSVNDKGQLGILSAIPTDIKSFEQLGYQLEIKEYSLLESLPAGIIMSKDRIVSYAKQMKAMLNPKTGGYKGLGGFVSMAKIYGGTWDWHRFWMITGTLSLILALMNFLPIPGLDGGYVVFTLWEMVTGQKPNDKFLEIATSLGLVLLLVLMVYANVNDIIRNFFN